MPARLLYIFFHSGVRCCFRVVMSSSCSSRGSSDSFLGYFSPCFVQRLLTLHLAQSVRENFVWIVLRPVWLVAAHQPVLFLP
jgi:hypothetical protein